MNTKITRPTTEDLRVILGATAIIEGGLVIPEGNVIEDVIEAIKPCVTILNAYRNHEALKKLAEEKITTIIMESTFSYGDKIQDSADALIEIMSSTGWKPKRVINTMGYGLDKLFLMCEPFGIDVYRIKDNFDRDSAENEEFELHKILYDGLDYDLLKAKYGGEFELAPSVK